MLPHQATKQKIIRGIYSYKKIIPPIAPAVIRKFFPPCINSANRKQAKITHVISACSCDAVYVQKTATNSIANTVHLSLLSFEIKRAFAVIKKSIRTA